MEANDPSQDCEEQKKQNTNHRCHVEQLDVHDDKAFYDEYQHVIPATCVVCGRQVEIVYNEGGIRDSESFEYIREFY